MPNDIFDKCPRCSGPFEQGLSIRSYGLPFYKPDVFANFVVTGEDLNRRSMIAKLLPTRARWSKAHVCRSCQVAVVEYGTSLSHKEAQQFAASLAPH